MYNDYDPNNMKDTVNNTKYSSYKNDYTTSRCNDDISIIAWIGILIALAIPFINIITIIAIAFAPENETLKNFGKASLILGGISILLLLMAF